MSQSFTSAYLFIDGGHLREYYKSAMSEWFGNDGEIDFNVMFLNSVKTRRNLVSINKLFYYDCLDNVPRNGENEDKLKARIAEQELYFENIKSIVGSHVRLGRLTGKSEKKKRQKEVDIRLTVDMLNHAFRRNFDHAILLSGDGDFKPVVEALVDMGVFVTVMGDLKHTSKDLKQAADAYFPLDFKDYYKFSVKSLQDSYPLPKEEQRPKAKKGGAPSIIETGTYHGKECLLHPNGTGRSIWLPELDGSQDIGTLYSHNDKERLKLFCKIRFGDAIQGIDFE